ncbi:MAG: flippase-like domain-containing protein [Bacteroidetes bacterium]|nr:flippase-like domain-containing protein [Bacteroidota bacterium]
METNNLQDFTDEQQKVLKKIRTSRVILPILIGIGVVGYLLWRQFDPQEFEKINWTEHAWFWIAASVALLIVRHIAYATRLRILSQGVFSWRKCIELIFIWEFSSAVSPTSLGGSAVAFFVLAQEKLSTAKTATIVLYTIVLDTIFFVGTLPVLFLVFGTKMIRPEMTSVYDVGGWGAYFILAYVLMTIYGTLFFLGLFKKPVQIKRFLVWITYIKFLRKYRHKMIALGNDMIIASTELRRQKWPFHLSAFVATATAWSCRFILLNFLIIAIVPAVPMDIFSQFELFARLQTMFVIIAFSPTPGGAGFVEILFGGFLSDFVTSPTYATVVSTIWRLLTYYAYLLVGAIIIPNWIRNVLNERARRRRTR